MNVRTSLGLISLAALAACGSNHGVGDSSTTNGVSSQPTPNAVCSEQPGKQICGPGNSSAAPLTGLTPTAPPSSTKPPRACRHQGYREHHPRRCAAANAQDR